MGSGKDLGPAVLFSICKSLGLDSPSLALPPARCVKRSAKDLQGDSAAAAAAAGQLLGFAQLRRK